MGTKLDEILARLPDDRRAQVEARAAVLIAQEGEPDAAEVERLVETIKPLLAHKGPALQGAALADLTAIWLAGRAAGGDAQVTRDMREELLRMHVRMVRELIPINARMIGTDR